jgi:hypothetical protein
MKFFSGGRHPAHEFVAILFGDAMLRSLIPYLRTSSLLRSPMVHRAEEKLTAFMELESSISRGYTLLMRKRLKATIPAKGNASHKVEKGSGTAGVSDTSSKYQVPMEGSKK